MEALTYRLDTFEGPLDLLLTLIQKNKVDISDIPIALICDQYMEYITAAEEMDMELASDFIVMASELMLIKSKMLLPRAEPEEEDPRAALAEALLKYRQAKEAAAKLGPAYTRFSGRMVKDTDEIAPDKTFVADQSVQSLCQAVRRIISFREERTRGSDKVTFTPMIASPIVPVEAKIVGILRHFPAPSGGKKEAPVALHTLLRDSASLPDMIAIFLGVLELLRMRRLRLVEDPDAPNAVYDVDAQLVPGENTENIASGSLSDYDTPDASGPSGETPQIPEGR